MSANITGAVAETSGFIPEVWAQGALDVLKANIVLTKRVARDYKFDDAQTQGKTINVGYPGTMTMRKKLPGQAAQLQTPQGGGTVPVVLDNHGYIDFLVEDVAEAQSNGQLLNRYLKSAAIGMAEGLETDLFTVLPSFTRQIGVAGTDMTKALTIKAREELNKAKNPATDRTFVVSDKDEAALLSDPTLAAYFANARPEAVAEGSIGRVSGFDVFPSQLVPVVPGTPATTRNFAFHEDAIMLATRPFKGIPEGAGARSQTHTQVDEETGILIRVIYEYSMSERGGRVGFDILYGFVKLRDEAGAIVRS